MCEVHMTGQTRAVFFCARLNVNSNSNPRTRLLESVFLCIVTNMKLFLHCKDSNDFIAVLTLRRFCGGDTVSFRCVPDRAIVQLSADCFPGMSLGSSGLFNSHAFFRLPSLQPESVCKGSSSHQKLTQVVPSPLLPIACRSVMT